MESEKQKVLKKAGRPSIYGEPTKIFQVKVPKSKINLIKEVVEAMLERYKIKK